jgi:molybdopterin synthase sulfur carrier subunit
MIDDRNRVFCPMTTVRIFGNLRDYTADSTIETPGDTVREVLQKLCESNDGLYQAIFDGDALQPHVRVMIDGRDIELDAGLDTPVSASQKIAIFPPIAGG